MDTVPKGKNLKIHIPVPPRIYLICRKLNYEIPIDPVAPCIKYSIKMVKKSKNAVKKITITLKIKKNLKNKRIEIAKIKNKN